MVFKPRSSRSKKALSLKRLRRRIKANDDSRKDKMIADRDLLQAADVRLVNNCGFDASIGIVYYDSKQSEVYVWSNIKKGSTFILRSVSDQTIYLYGFDEKKPNKVIWGTSNSKHCISKGECLEPKNVGKLSTASVVRYKLCKVASPTASPISRAPPTDTTSLTDTEVKWLNGHNTRRKNYFAQNSLGPKDLKWSETLKNSAQQYANRLLELGGDNKCVIQHGYDGDEYGGENLHTNWGTSISTVSASPDEVLNGWFDEEINLPFGQNGHATQVVFRSTHYVGCGQSQKKLSNGGKCFINVCRYLSPGNCNMSRNGWKSRTLDDDAQCPPLCPPEGCF
jgi:Cysteine-rich secretory protein family